MRIVFELGEALLLAPAEAALALPAAPRQIVPNGLDVQGEAVAWSRTGGFWHGSETFAKVVARLWRVPCAQSSKP